MNKSSQIIVICAIIEYDAGVLVVQRSPSMKLPLKWEFPGGKLEDGETEEQCIIREIKEELDIVILPKREYSKFCVT
jgi:8-oxo-dGTP diphosphatase